MEILCKEVDEKIRVDFENEEIQDIIKAIEILLRRFVEALCDINKEIKIDRLELCGSIAEKTRIWEPVKGTCDIDLEFDYIAVLKSWPGCGKFVFIPYYEEGKMQIKFEVTDRQSAPGKYTPLHTAIKLSFINTVLKGIKAACERNMCTRQLSSDPSLAVQGCPCCTVYMRTGNLRCTNVPVLDGKVETESVLSFVWSSIKRSTKNPFRFSRLPNTSPDPSAQDMFKIKVDFHPVIEINKDMIEPKEDGTTISLDKDTTYFLFPNGHSVNGMFTGSVDWRVSAYHSELELLKGTSREHTLAFCVLKFIGKAFNTYGNQTLKYAESYEVKCIVLNHIKSCRAPRRGAHMCLLDMIKDIYECARYKDLSHPTIPSYNVYPKNDFYYSDTLAEQKTSLWKTFISLLDQQKNESIKDLYYDIKTLNCIEESMRKQNVNSTTFCVDFLKRRREASAEEVCKEKISFVFLPDVIENLTRMT